MKYKYNDIGKLNRFELKYDLIGDMSKSDSWYNYKNKYLTFEALEDCVFTITSYSLYGGGTITKDMRESFSYSIDNGKTWVTYMTPLEGISSDGALLTTPIIHAGEKVLWKGIGTLNHVYYYRYNKFTSTGNFNVSGNIMSLSHGDNGFDVTDLTGTNSLFSYLFIDNYKLINASNLILPATTLASRCYMNMFENCSNLITIPELPATTLSEFCYDSMFRSCTSLTSIPDLPAMTLTGHCYQRMFQDCSSLTVISKLPATTLADSCYDSMFIGCTNLKLISIILPATTLTNMCYREMFSECIRLTTIPKNLLPATTLAQNCYGGMFRGCTSLTTAPVLPATTLAQSCYNGMFSNCTSLTTAPELLATTLISGCYGNMFNGCTNLNYIKALFTGNPQENCTEDWVKDVASNGIFIRNVDTTWYIFGDSGIPYNWTIEPSYTLRTITLYSALQEENFNFNRIQNIYFNSESEDFDISLFTENNAIGFSNESVNLAANDTSWTQGSYNALGNYKYSGIRFICDYPGYVQICCLVIRKGYDASSETVYQNESAGTFDINNITSTFNEILLDIINNYHKLVITNKDNVGNASTIKDMFTKSIVIETY